MRQVIEKLRQKPESHRKGIAFGVSAAFTILLALIWGVTLPVRFAAIDAKAKGQPAAVLGASPIDTLRASLNQTSSIENQPSTGGSVTPSISPQAQASKGVVISDINSGVSPFNGE